MIKVICDKCSRDCGLNAYALTVEVIHNPVPHNVNDSGRIKITQDDAYMRFVLCQDCYEKLNFPNIYKVVSEKSIDFENYPVDVNDLVYSFDEIMYLYDKETSVISTGLTAYSPDKNPESRDKFRFVTIKGDIYKNYADYNRTWVVFKEFPDLEQLRE